MTAWGRPGAGFGRSEVGAVPVGVFAGRRAGLSRAGGAGAECAVGTAEGTDPLHADSALARLTIRATFTPERRGTNITRGQRSSEQRADGSYSLAHRVRLRALLLVTADADHADRRARQLRDHHGVPRLV